MAPLRTALGIELMFVVDGEKHTSVAIVELLTSKSIVRLRVLLLTYERRLEIYMKKRSRRFVGTVLACLALCGTTASLQAQTAAENADDKAEAKKQAGASVEISLADGTIKMMSPKGWESKKPRFPQMIKYEFVAPADAKKDAPTARITLGGTGGSVAANIARWKGQFEGLDKKSELTKFDASKLTVHWADLRGSYKDTMGAPPFAGRAPTIREDYRMLGAFIETKKGGLQYIKMIGPASVVDAFVKPMKKMLEDLKTK